MLVFDVGANDGSNSIHRALDGDIVYAFEPHPGMCDIIYNRIEDIPNYNLVRKAVSDFNGRAAFHIFESEDCSSLSDLNPGCEEKWSNLKGRLGHLVTIEVEVITLKKFIIENKIKQIDWLHCDAQGHDLNVLKGLGEFHRIVKAGVIETVKNKDVALYKGQYTLEDVKNWMQEKGFQIDSINENDVEWKDGVKVYGGNEFNVYFSNPNFISLE